MADTKRHKRCWKDLAEHLEETDRDAYYKWYGSQYPNSPINKTCMLPDGHAGPHQFTPDDEITVSFDPKT